MDMGRRPSQDELLRCDDATRLRAEQMEQRTETLRSILIEEIGALRTSDFVNQAQRDAYEDSVRRIAPWVETVHNAKDRASMQTAVRLVMDRLFAVLKDDSTPCPATESKTNR